MRAAPAGKRSLPDEEEEEEEKGPEEGAEGEEDRGWGSLASLKTHQSKGRPATAAAEPHRKLLKAGGAGGPGTKAADNTTRMVLAMPNVTVSAGSGLMVALAGVASSEQMHRRLVAQTDPTSPQPSTAQPCRTISAACG